MGDKEEHLRKLLILLDKVANRPGNEWFMEELKKQYSDGPTQDSRELKEEQTSTSDSIAPIKKDTETIIEQVNRVTNKFDIIDEEIEKRAKSFYLDFNSTDDLKTELIKNYELFELSLKKEDHKLASKYVIVQLEGILNLFEQELIAFEENNPEREYSQLKYISTYKGKKTMPFRTKCNSIRTYKDIKYIDYNKISLVYEIRNFESHQFASDKIKDCEEKLEELKKSPNEHYSEIYKLIKICLKLKE